MNSQPWSKEPKILAREGINVHVEIANEENAIDQSFQMVGESLLIDTGADRTGIRKDILERLHLEATGTVEMSVVGGVRMTCPRYRARKYSLPAAAGLSCGIAHSP
jgi:hypothetical protein